MVHLFLMEPLTEKQKNVFEFIRDAITRRNMPPTIREIACKFRFSSTGTVRDYLHSLEAKGYIKLKPMKARSIELLFGVAGIPLVGTVPAGPVKLAADYIEEYIDVGTMLSDTKETFALKVKGDSMKDKGIMEGDTVIVRRQKTCVSGDIVVALFGDEATVKTFKRSGNKIFLEPANENYKPIVCNENTAIIGKVVGVWRKYV